MRIDRNIEFDNKEFYINMLKIAIPIALQSLIQSSLNMIDTIMIGKLGETQIAAVGLANQVFFIFCIVLFGINSGCSIFFAQFWGKKDVINIRRMLGICISLSFIISLMFFIVNFFAPYSVMRLFTKDIEVITIGGNYLRIVSSSFLICSISFSYSSVLKSTQKILMPVLLSIGAVLVNTVLNYILIFGKLGFNKMGANGAATATLIAITAEMIVLLIFVYIDNNSAAGSIKELTSFNKEYVLKVLKTSMPVLINETLWVVGVSIYKAAYARMSTETVASVNIANTVESLAFVLFIGLANACSIMIGKEIGGEREEHAKIYSRKFISISMLFAVLVGIVLYFSAYSILSIFDVSTQVYLDAVSVIRIIAVFMPIKVFNLLVIVGILRSGGDTLYSMIADVIGVYLVGIPFAFVAGLVWKLPIDKVFLLVSLEELLKLLIVLPRFLSNKWVRNLVKGMS